MKRALLLLAVLVAISVAFGYGYLALRPNPANHPIANTAGQASSPPAGQASVPDAGASGTETQPVVGLPPSDRVWTAGTDDVPVIMYHDVVPRKQVWFDLTTREFEEQMQAIKDAGATVVPLSDVVNHLKTGEPLPSRAIALTFDDNTVGIYENAFPIMQRFGYHSTQFVHTGKVGVKTEKVHCTWDQLREMQDTGLVEVGSHTIDHPADLRKLTPDQVRAQLTISKASIEAELGKPCRYFAYTEGNGDENTAQMVAAAGYEGAWNEARAWDASPCDRLFMARFAPFRLNDILAHWKEEDARPRTQTAGVDLKAVKSAEPRDERAGGLAVTLTYASWPDMVPSPRDPSEIAGFSVPGILLDSSRGGEAPDNRQWDWVSRPMVIANNNQAFIVGYQPWMGASAESLRVLLPEATFAVVGVEALVHNGTPVEARTWKRGRRLPNFIGWKADGTPVLGRATRFCRRDALIGALRDLGMKEAVLLGR